MWSLDNWNCLITLSWMHTMHCLNCWFFSWIKRRPVLHLHSPPKRSCRQITWARSLSEEGAGQSAHSGEGGRTHSPASMIHWVSFPSNFPFKIYPGWAESLEFVSGHESTILPDYWLCWLKDLSFLLTLCLLILVYEQWTASQIWIGLQIQMIKYWTRAYGGLRPLSPLRLRPSVS